MARPKILDSAYSQIADFFESFDKRAFTERKLKEIIYDYWERWQLGASRNASRVISYLEEKGDLKGHVIQEQQQGNALSRYVRIYSWRTEDEYTIISALKNNSYFSYYTALFFHQLTLQIPKTYYINFERSPSTSIDRQSVLTQKAIDAAFASKQRKSQLEFAWKDKKIVITNGKYNGKLGVMEQRNETQAFQYTDLERTLIDASVRPAYTGGVFEVLEAYRKAKDRIDVDKLAHYLEELDYTYPYHQVLGFYLQHAHYGESDLKNFRKKPEHKFYLTYNIRNPRFSEEWSLYYPKGF